MTTKYSVGRPKGSTKEKYSIYTRASKKYREYPMTIKMSDSANLLIYNNFKNLELNLLAVILSSLTREKNKDKYTIEISKKELTTILDYSEKTMKSKLYPGYLEEFGKKLIQDILIVEKDEKKTKIAGLFKEIGVARDTNSFDLEENVIVIECNEKQIDNIRNYENHYFKYKVIDYIKIKNKTAKRIYQLIKQWETVGKKRFGTDELFKLCNIKDSYKSRLQSVLDPAINELKIYYPGLKYEKEKGGKFNEVKAITFYWKQPEKESPENVEVNSPYSIKGAFKEDLKDNGRE
jgi:hypothetical protein